MARVTICSCLTLASPASRSSSLYGLRLPHAPASPRPLHHLSTSAGSRCSCCEWRSCPAAPGLGLECCALWKLATSSGREILEDELNPEGTGPAKCPGWRRWPREREQSLRPRLSFHIAFPEHHSGSLGSCASCSRLFRSPTYPLFTFNLAVLAEMILITQEGLAEKLS